jgi:solute carrier family 27 (fatty acid transporter), member 1/4
MTVGQALVRGCTVVLRKKFSASQYFTDCRQYSCTAAQYIGEMCRYMLATSPSAADKDHQVRVMYGNGLRAPIWKKFVERFNIAEVREFYASTEGNTNISE